MLGAKITYIIQLGDVAPVCVCVLQVYCPTGTPIWMH